MAGRYIIKTPLNPTYSGKVCGVRIENGQGVLDSSTIDPKTGLTVERVLTELQTLGDQYQVIPLGDVTAPPPAEAEPAGTSDKGQRAYKKQPE